MGALDKIFLNGTKLEVVWNQIKKNFFPTTPAATGDVTITFTRDSNNFITAITTAIGNGKVTNDMLAGSIANGKLASNGVITINTNSLALGQSYDLATFLGYLSPNAANGIVKLDSNGKILLSLFPDAVIGNVMFGGTVGTVSGKTYLSASLTESAKRKIEQKMQYAANTLDGKTIRIANVATTTVSSSIYTLGWEACEGIYFLWNTGTTAPETWAGSTFEVGDWLISIGAITSPETTGWKKIDNTDAVTSVNGRVGAITLTSTDVGLGNVGNFLAVSTVASQGLTTTQQSNARANIGLGTAATHAHGDYVTDVSWDSTNNKLAWSKGGTAQTAIEIVQATQATKLTTVSKTLFGNTYWTSGGIPTSVGTSSSPAALNYVTNIDSLVYFDRTNNRVGIGIDSPTAKLHVSGDLKVADDIQSTGGDIFASAGGVAAYGIADLDIGAGGGGTGTVTSIKFGDATTITPVDGLLSVTVGQGSSNGTISIGGQEVAVKGLGALAYLNAVPIATSDAIGGIKIGYTTDVTNRNYGVQLSSEQAYVNVPWTDTLNTAGTTNKASTKMYLVGATGQSANPQTYSNVNCYIGTDNCLYSGGSKVLTSVAFSDLTSHPTTISGYGITDAKLEHSTPTGAGTNTAHKITLGDKVLYIYFNSAETTDADSNKLGSFDITISDNADPSASGANTKTFSFGTLTKAQIESICTL